MKLKYTVVDVCVTDCGAPQCDMWSTDKFLIKHEQAKKMKYFQACLFQWIHVALFVFSAGSLIRYNAVVFIKQSA